MKRVIVATLATAALGIGLAASNVPAPQAANPRRTQPPTAAPRMATSHGATTMAYEAQDALVNEYCLGCHDADGRAGGLSLEDFRGAKADAMAPIAEKMIRKLRAGMMPPSTAPKRPDPAAVKAFAEALEAKIDAAAAANPNPGWRPFQRLNRAEYAQAIHDLLAIDVDVAAFLPPDTISHSFDNIADVQSFSPTLMEGYLRAASQISRVAVGDRNATPTSVTYKLGRTMSQMRHVDGAPMGTRGGISTVHTFPADGDYVFRLSLHYAPLGQLFGRTTMSTMNISEQVDISIDGERVALLTLNPRMSETDPKNPLDIKTPPIHVKAGSQRVSAAFIQHLDGPIDDLLVPLENTLADVDTSFGITSLPHMRDFSIVGPMAVTGVSDTPSRRRIFTCRPTTADEEAPCAQQIVRHLATEAYREPVAADDFADLMTFYEQGRKKGDFENGIRLSLQALLASPRFLFRAEEAPVGLKTASYRINDIDLASRLSFFLWDTVPDDELVKVASHGRLKNPAVFEKQIRRMIADPRSEALSRRFASQWLRLQDLDKIHPDYLQYPQYEDTLAQAMHRETELFFDSIVREDHNVLDLLTADYSFVNGRLAKHYGIPNIAGSEFRRVPLPEYRRGLLGQGSILTLTSVADRTSPVQRGKWVMEVMLGAPPPPPPPNVPALDDSVKASEGGHRLSTRERMEEHRKNPACNSCHRVIDPLGLALDNFDVTGAWRIKDNEVPVDSDGVLYDGSKISGPAGLRNAILKHQDVFLLSFTESLMTYALGRRVEYFDMPAIRTIIRDAQKNDLKMSSFILGVANSAAFRMAKPAEGAKTTENDRGPERAAPQMKAPEKPASQNSRRPEKAAAPSPARPEKGPRR